MIENPKIEEIDEEYLDQLAREYCKDDSKTRFAYKHGYRQAYKDIFKL